MSLRKKITLLVLLAGLIPLLVIAGAAHYLAQGSLAEVTMVQLSSIRATKKAGIERYFSQHKKDVSLLAQTVENMRGQAKNILEQLRDTNQRRVANYLQERLKDISILATNSDLSQSMTVIDWVFRDAGKKAGSDKWTRIVDQKTPWLDSFRATNDYEDLYLISVSGNVYFTSSRGGELGINLKDPANSTTPLGQLFSNAIKQITFVDQQADVDGTAPPLAYIGAPVEHKGKVIGIIAVSLGLKKLLTPILSTEGAGNEGAVYLVGPDKMLRSDYLLANPIPTPGTTSPFVASEAVNQALAGESGSGIVSNAGQPRLAAWSSFQMGDYRWGIVAESSPNEAFDSTSKKGLDRKYLDASGYYDLFLIKPSGLVFHTAARQKDYGTNLLTGPYADSNLAKLLQEVLQSKKPGMTDIAPYAPSNGEPAAFMAAPIIQNGQVEMVVALQLPLEGLNQILTPGNSLGPLGDIYLVGPDQRMRSDSYRHPETHSVLASFNGSIEHNSLNSPAVAAALAGKTGTMSGSNKKTIYAYTPISIGVLNWALVLETGPAGGGALTNLIDTLTMICLGFVPFIILLAWKGGSSTVRPLAIFSELIAQLSQGNFAVEMPGDRDKIGNLANQVIEMVSRLKQMTVNIRQAAMGLIKYSRDLAEHIETQTKSTGKSTANCANYAKISAAVTELEAALRHTGEQDLATEQDAEVAAMDVADTTRSVNEAAAASRDVSERIFALEEVSRQIRLLALNAGVEAARSGAGDEALVATTREIRDLAERSRVAISELHRLSTSCTRVTKQAGEILGNLSRNIRKSVEQIRTHADSRDVQQESLRQLLAQVAILTEQSAGQEGHTTSDSSPGMIDATAKLNQKSEALLEALASFIPPDVGDISADTKKNDAINDDFFDNMGH